MQTRRFSLGAAWTEHFSQFTSYFVTLTFNWRGTVYKKSATTRLRTFSRILDERRLGKRFYEAPPASRTSFIFVPEYGKECKLHYHGLLAEPDDTHARMVPNSYPDFIRRCWKATVPSGTCDVQSLYSPGAIIYSTKYTLIDSDDTVSSLDMWSARTK